MAATAVARARVVGTCDSVTDVCACPQDALWLQILAAHHGATWGSHHVPLGPNVPISTRTQEVATRRTFCVPVWCTVLPRLSEDILNCHLLSRK